MALPDSYRAIQTERSDPYYVLRIGINLNLSPINGPILVDLYGALLLVEVLGTFEVCCIAMLQSVLGEQFMCVGLKREPGRSLLFATCI